MSLCYICQEKKPNWYNETGPDPITLRDYCQNCFLGLIQIPSKHLLIGRLSFISKPHYLGITTQETIDKLIKEKHYSCGLFYWEFWNTEINNLTQVVSYRAPLDTYEHWYIYTRDNLLHLANDSFGIAQSVSNYNSALVYIHSARVNTLTFLLYSLSIQPVIYSERRSRFSALTESQGLLGDIKVILIPKVWRLTDLAAFAVRTNVLYHGIKAFSRLPSILKQYVIAFDAVRLEIDKPVRRLSPRDLRPPLFVPVNEHFLFG
jgi:hypothetical protein